MDPQMSMYNLYKVIRDNLYISLCNIMITKYML